MRLFPRVLCSALVLCGLTGCSFFESDDNKPRLEGERISVLELQKTLEPEDAALSAQGLVVPGAWRNEFWPQAGGYPNHAMQHLSLSPDRLERVWSVSIGRGGSSDLPLITQPVVVDNTVYTLDSHARLAAFDTSDGKQLWDRDVSRESERDPVIGGGLSYSRGVLYVTNGYNEVIALDYKNGEEIWRVNIPAPSRAAPTVVDERVFVTTLDNRLLALSASDGTFLWDYAGISETTGLVGAASPAASHELVVPVFSSGEVFALRAENGSLSWSENLSSLRRYAGLSALSDIRGLPVIDKGLVIVIGMGGRLVAIDERSGRRVWQREIGGSETPWVAGNHLFVMSSENELVALGRDNGVISWVTPLSRYKKDGDKSSGSVIWTGPVLAGGRLILAGTDGRVAEVNPENGDIIREWSAGRTVMISPVVADETLYLLASDGTLMAYR